MARVRVDTVRYYERLGILPPAVRGPSGYRLFEHSAIERIKLVKQLQDLGLTLDEVKAMLGAITNQGSDCAQESRRIAAVLSRTEEKLAALAVTRDTLRGALERCSGGNCDLVSRARATAPTPHGTKRRPKP
ncbi:MAG: MerR-family transcriptional regulator [Myxococcaceae bacterium]|jgi:DNA-binding transcriptional MerR regulator|nr:MerR-family transcriptional regulator [Myxococcaceae bacterium]